MTYRELWEKGKGLLIEAGTGDADIDASLLLEKACGTTRQALYSGGEMPVDETRKELYLSYIRRRSEHEPAAYILGEQGFMGLMFGVDSRVLIPRQDTENLAEEVLKELCSGMRILDLCTGSGCILLSLLHYSSGTTGTGTDLSPEALEVAEMNAERLGLSERAAFSCGDLFGASKAGGKFEIIVSNPPYIGREVLDTLMPEVIRHEPRAALDGGPDGLSFYRRITGEAPDHLVIGGLLFVEIGYDQGPAVKKLFEEAGFADVRVIRDYGGNDRIVRGEMSLRTRENKNGKAC